MADKHIRERANVLHRIKELRKAVKKYFTDDPGCDADPKGEALLEYILTTIEYQQREIEALEKRVNKPRLRKGYSPTRPGVLVK